MDLQNLPEGTPVWVTAAVVLTTLAITLSEKAAKIPGALGSAARWWSERQLRGAERRKTLDDKIDGMVDDKVGRWRSEVDGAIKNLEERVAELRATERSQHAYIVWITSHFRRFEIWAADRDLELPPPPFQTYTEWLAETAARDEPRPRRPPPDDGDAT